MTIVPIILMGIVVTVLSYYVFLRTIKLEVERSLDNVAESVILQLDYLYPGDYAAEKISDNEYKLYKGGVDISERDDLIQAYFDKTNIDITVFFLDIRMLTTLKSVDGDSIKYTISNKSVSDAVINGGQNMFYDNIEINDAKYYAYYKPLYNGEKCIGMIAVARPGAEIEKESRKALNWIPVVTLIMTLFAAIFSFYPAKRLIGAIDIEKRFLDEISRGNLNAEIDKEVTERGDELGDMARFSRSVQKFLREMIERDTLTRLYTRRIGESKISYAQAQYDEAGVKYCVCMGDIDYFKKFNDTYGHDCGDLVLRDIASIFNEYMLGKGFAVRWGGEEFLIVFEDADLDKALIQLKALRQKVLEHELNYEGEKLRVTMTFGIVQGDMKQIEEIIMMTVLCIRPDT